METQIYHKNRIFADEKTGLTTEQALERKAAGLYYEQVKGAEKTAAEIDDEVKAIIDRAYARCEEILTARREVLTAVAVYLLAHETMTGEEFERMVGEKA